LIPVWVKVIAESDNAVLLLSLCFNAVACAAIWRIWKSREALGDRVTMMLVELLKELTRK